MQENKNDRVLEKELKEKLNWYTLRAAEDDFDEKAVESILYLLDHTAPLDEDTIPSPDEAWDKFRTIVKDKKELLPLKEDQLPKNPYLPDKKPGKFRAFVLRHKIFAAAVLLVLILAVSGTVRVGANMFQNNGFFFWMKRDDSGTQMITSPEDLDVITSKDESLYFDREDLPEWTQEWIQIENEFEMPEGYEWQYCETSELADRRQITNHYINENVSKEIFLGVWIYSSMAYYSEDFADYNYINCYEISQKQMDIYKRTEETGKIFYMICFYEENCRYFIRGEDNLEELKVLADQYLNCVKNNL